ncbi:cell wall-binding repeat-containing protein [Mahella sp.]|uniref:cell wall-binding repeat-containing protein n=1 Tax=Mahella sp. TaxID=2798721 RepID=UPI0025BC3462|nr:cell wall-binding repeat-containing protein [Mahella sp.]MBZ4665964.1 cell wall binding repeat 2-containing protein [Mahella sp.]
MSKPRKAESITLLLALAFVFTSLFSGIGAVGFAADEGTRLYGSDRYETAAEISQKGWKSSDSVVLVSGQDFPDALVAGPLAQKLDAPILLTMKDKLPDVTKDEIDRLDAKKVYIVGGTAAVSEDVADTIDKPVKRICGNDKHETAVAVAKELKDLGVSTDGVIITRSDDYADALAAAAVKPALPILFAGSHTDTLLPETTENALVDLGVKDVVIVGDIGAVSEAIEEQIGNVVSYVFRVGGDDRFKTAAQIAAAFVPDDGYKGVVLATGKDYPDALAGGPYAAKNGYALLLTGDARNPVDDTVIDLIRDNTAIMADVIVILGGPKVVPDKAVSDVIDAGEANGLSTIDVY